MRIYVMKKRIIIGLIFGIIAGIIDVIPMIIQKLPISADLSAFSLWVISGFLISSSELNIPSILKGIIISFLVLIPALILIIWSDFKSIIPIGAMTLILSGLLGFMIEKFGK
jgi:hypothetical protein